MARTAGSAICAQRRAQKLEIHHHALLGVALALDKITAIEGSMVEVQDKDKPKLLPIGKNYRDELLELIEKNRL